MSADGITVSSSSRVAARRLGALAWVILEDLALQARLADHELVADTNVRELARNLGVGKDTVAKALGRLIDIGLISVRSRRRAGRYVGSSYVLDVEACSRAGIVVTSLQSQASPYPVAPRPIQPDTVIEHQVTGVED